MLTGRKDTGRVGQARDGAHSVIDVMAVSLIIATGRTGEAFWRKIQGEMAGLMPA